MYLICKFFDWLLTIFYGGFYRRESYGIFYRRYAILPTIIDDRIVWLQPIYTAVTMIYTGGYKIHKITKEEYLFKVLTGNINMDPWEQL